MFLPLAFSNLTPFLDEFCMFNDLIPFQMEEALVIFASKDFLINFAFSFRFRYGISSKFIFFINSLAI